MRNNPDAGEYEEIDDSLSSSKVEEEVERRKEKIKLAERSGKKPFGERFEVNSTASHVGAHCDEMGDRELRLAGRLMAFRGHGRATFADIRDRTGRIQIHARLDILGDEYENFRRILDIGDIIGIVGKAFRTKRGEPTIEVLEWTLLSKSLRPLPEKWHGLTDVDLRYRQRYLDLIVNPKVLETFVKRTKIISYIRDYLDKRGFLEVQTPILQTIAGGANARPFVTHHNALDIDVYMRIATELYLKRLIVGGLERVYEIGPNFRNEGISTRHNPEFYLLEVYQAYADYTDMMTIVEEIVSGCAMHIQGSMKFMSGGHEIDVTPPWRRLRLWDAVEEAVGVGPQDLRDDTDAEKVAKKLNLNMDKTVTKSSVIEKIVDEFVEPKLIQPVFLMDYPVEISPLAKRMPDNPYLTHRFEPFVLGRELGNAFTELNDPMDQRERFLAQAKEKAAGDEEAHPYDEDFIRALEYGMAPTGGLGIGIERLVMLLTDNQSIRDVMLFPMMKPKA